MPVSCVPASPCLCLLVACVTGRSKPVLTLDYLPKRVSLCDSAVPVSRVADASPRVLAAGAV